MTTGIKDGWLRRHVLLPGLSIYDFFRPAVFWLEDVTWKRRGKPYPPPPPVKQRTVLAYRKRLSLEVLIETGTFLGDMIQATKDAFARIISIELDKQLCARARRRFAQYPHVTILQGDSAEILPQLLAEVDRPSLFWLDAHYSGNFTRRGSLETPIMAELAAILSRRVADYAADDAILIDDVRAFDGQNGYPELSAVSDFVLERRPGWHWEVRDDIARFHRPLNETKESL